MPLSRWMAAAAVAVCALAGGPGNRSLPLGLQTAAAQDKDSFTPMPLDSGFGRMDISDPAIPPDQIIKQFAAKETEFQEALNHYTYRRTARVDTIDDDTKKVSGEWYEVDDVIFDPSGRRMERAVDAPPSTLDQGGIIDDGLRPPGHPARLSVRADHRGPAQIQHQVRWPAEGG